MGNFKMVPFILSLSLAAVLVVGQGVLAEQHSDHNRMMDMMESGNMSQMIKDCGTFMSSYQDHYDSK